MHTRRPSFVLEMLRSTLGKATCRTQSFLRKVHFNLRTSRLNDVCWSPKQSLFSQSFLYKSLALPPMDAYFLIVFVPRSRHMTSPSRFSLLRSSWSKWLRLWVRNADVFGFLLWNRRAKTSRIILACVSSAEFQTLMSPRIFMSEDTGGADAPLATPLVTGLVNYMLKLTYRKFEKRWADVFELFFCKKIPLSRRVEYVMGGWISEWISGSVDQWISERCMFVTSWNSLPDHYRTISDFNSFRRQISTGKNNLLKRAANANLGS